MNKSALMSTLNNFNKIHEQISTIEKLTEKDVLNDYCGSEINCIDSIAKLENANVTKIADKMNMTRGAISKVTKKLIEKGTIVSYQLECNKKEIYFNLTELGEKIYKEHEQWHKDWDQRSTLFFDDYPVENLNTVQEFLQIYQNYLDYKIENIKIRKKQQNRE